MHRLLRQLVIGGVAGSGHEVNGDRTLNREHQCGSNAAAVAIIMLTDNCANTMSSSFTASRDSAE